MSEYAAYAEALIRGIAARMVDPHRGFEQRMLGELQALQSESQIRKFIAKLFDCINGDLLSESQRRGLAADLRRANWPNVDDFNIALAELDARAGPMCGHSQKEP